MPIHDRRDRARHDRLDSVAAEAWAAIMSAAGRIAERSEPVFARHGLTADQYQVLALLRGVYPAGYPRCDVARRLTGRSPDVTRLLDRLEKRRLITRARSSDDARLSVATITRAGVALLARVEPEMNAVLEAVMRQLNEAQLRHVARLCDAIVT